MWAIMQKLRITAGSVDPGRGLLTFFLTINGSGEELGQVSGGVRASGQGPPA